MAEMSETDLEGLSLEELENLESQLQTGEGDSSYGSPMPEKKDSWFNFIREIIKSSDTRKFGNLKDKELGFIPLSIRDRLHISNVARKLELGDVGDYMEELAEKDISTSLSKDGFLPNITVTQIKKEQKVAAPTKEEKKPFFSRKE